MDGQQDHKGEKGKAKKAKKAKKVKKSKRSNEMEFGSELSNVQSFDQEMPNPLSRDSVADSECDSPTDTLQASQSPATKVGDVLTRREDFSSEKEMLASMSKAERKAYKIEQKQLGSKESRKNNRNDVNALDVGHSVQNSLALSTNNRRIFDDSQEEIDERQATQQALEESGASLVQVDRAEMNAFLQSTVFGVAVDEGGILDEEEALLAAQKAKWGGILHPDTKVKGAYDILQLIILLYLAWALPNRVAFTKTATGWQIIIDLLIDAAV